MCGIAGFWGGNHTEDEVEGLLRRMGNAIVHRGPDDAGIWFDSNSNIGLAHQRLSILDLSESGSQPMTSSSNRYVIVFNGEIYNHLDIRLQIEKDSEHSISWRGHSDTETILAGVECWGIDQTLSLLNGMFAFALWDMVDCSLLLARDRVGEKPLYFGIQHDYVYFASELSAICANPNFKAQIDRNALSSYFQNNCIPCPLSIYQDIAKLEPGSLVKISKKDIENRSIPKSVKYWSFDEVIERGLKTPFNGSDNEAILGLEKALLKSVDRQQLSDVPIGAFLSGGIDSSLVVSLMQSLSEQPINTFTIGFHDKNFNEASQALSIANYLGTDHHELYVSAIDALHVIPRLPLLYDEPFADPSQIPTFIVSKMARQTVTVALSGDGGDELFGGYNRYLLSRKVWNKLYRAPLQLRVLIAKVLNSPSPRVFEIFFRLLLPLVPKNLRFSQPIDKLFKIIDILTVSNPRDIYHILTSQPMFMENITLASKGPEANPLGHPLLQSDLDLEHWMMALDTETYLPDDVLVKVDRAAMGVSLETRVPLLDHEIVEMAWSLPLDLKIRDGQGKWILRQVLHKYVPKNLFDDTKKGFGVPLADWLRGPLRDWGEDLLDENKLRNQGYINPVYVQKIWREHQEGKQNWQYKLWTILMFQAWYESQYVS